MLLVLLRYFRSHGAGDSVASAHIVGEVNADLAAARECKGFGVQAGRGCKCVFEAELKWLALIGGKINTRRSSLRLPRWNSSRTLNTASGGIDDYDRLITVLVHSFYGLPSLMTVAIVGRRGGSRLPILGLLIDPGRSCVVPLLVVGGRGGCRAITVSGRRRYRGTAVRVVRPRGGRITLARVRV